MSHGGSPAPVTMQARLKKERPTKESCAVHRRRSMHLHLCFHYSSRESVIIVTATSDAPLVGIAKRSGAPDEIVSKRNDASANSRRDLQRAQMPRPRPAHQPGTNLRLGTMRGKAQLLTMVKGSNWQVSDIGDLKGDHVWEHGDRWRCVARQRDGRQR